MIHLTHGHSEIRRDHVANAESLQKNRQRLLRRNLGQTMTDQETPQAATSVSAKSSAVKAGWICLVLGFLTFWIFGFGFIFFAATFILAIVAMCTNRVGQGIVLLVSSVGSSIVCVNHFARSSIERFYGCAEEGTGKATRKCYTSSATASGGK